MRASEGRLLAFARAGCGAAPSPMTRPGDLHRLLDEPAELRRQPPLETYLFSIAAHKLDDTAAAGRRRRCRSAWTGRSSSFEPAGRRALQAATIAAANAADRGASLVEAIDAQLRHWHGGATGRRSSAPNCSSSADGPTSRWPPA